MSNTRAFGEALYLFESIAKTLLLRQKAYGFICVACVEIEDVGANYHKIFKSSAIYAWTTIPTSKACSITPYFLSTLKTNAL